MSVFSHLQVIIFRRSFLKLCTGGIQTMILFLSQSMSRLLTLAKSLIHAVLRHWEYAASLDLSRWGNHHRSYKLDHRGQIKKYSKDTDKPLLGGSCELDNTRNLEGSICKSHIYNEFTRKSI